jgi:polysaccharide export outer membrane protein
VSLLASLLGSVLVLGAGTVGCGSSRPYVWVDDLPHQGAADNDFRIRTTDTLNVRVFNQDPLSTRQRVRQDGRISIPVVGDLVAVGKRPADLAHEIEEKLKNVVVVPKVSVAVDESAQITVSVLGEVRNAGAYQMDASANVLNALAAAGGLSDYADKDRVFVLRRGQKSRIRFRFSDLQEGDPKSINYPLNHGDVVLVE